ncbi:hypothetical protein ACH5RR_023252 [Cinchona calisaya]|uniref:BAH domain-containing protein n=1 Tax=Cinchona calisaya TaxID=153742 RepID=A0ABD2ZA48_9GENT
MPDFLEVKEEEILEFSWGRKRSVGGPNNDVQFYDSFTYDGIEYSLYDCVYMWADDQPEPYIGKLVKIWETASHKKKVKVVWFLRPIEIRHWLGDIKLLKTEIFLAIGEGKGLFNLNPLEAISGKCNVVCVSKDVRNAQATEEDLRDADYVFFRTFDVGSCKVSTDFADEVAGVEVKHYFNLRKVRKSSLNTELKAKTETFGSFTAHEVIKDGQTGKIPNSLAPDISLDEQINCRVQNGSTTGASQFELKVPAANLIKGTNFPMKDGTSIRVKMKFSDISTSTKVPDIQAQKKRKLQCSLDEATGAKIQSQSSGYEEKFVNVKDTFSNNRSLSKGVNVNDKIGNSSYQLGPDKGMKSESQIMEVTSRLNTDSSKWFKLQSWEDRMNAAYEKGTLVLLENLDPSYTSAEVEEIVSHAFSQQVNAKMIQHSTFSGPNYGKAFVIFKSKDAADSVIYELKRRCLMIGDQRPVVARRGKLKDPHDTQKFFGHLSIPKVWFQKQHEDKRNAVSTSHYSQRNTVECDMAMEWYGLYERSKLWWEALHKAQTKEMEFLRNQNKVHHLRE